MSGSYSKKEEKLIIKLREEGHDWSEISCQVSFLEGNPRSAAACRQKHKSLVGSGQAKKSQGKFTKKVLGDISVVKEVEKSQIFVIGSVSPMTKADRSNSSKEYFEPNLHELAFKSLQNYLKRNKAELFLMPMRAHVSSLTSQPFHYDPGLKKFKRNFTTNLSINKVLKVLEAHLNPQMVKPNTGLGNLVGKKNKFLFEDIDQEGRVGDVFHKNKSSSIIIAHPKQMMDIYPTGFESAPRVIHSTGSLTCPQYLENRVGMLATEGHMLGFLIVEIKGSKFWIRQVQCNEKTGEFVSMGVRYHADGSAKRERADTISFGDLHLGEHKESSLNCAYDMIRYFKPEHTMWHDVVSGKSGTHHNIGKQIEKAMMPFWFRSFQAEGEYCSRKLKEIYKVLEENEAKGHIVSSNHDNHIKENLNKFRFAKEDQNVRLGTDLAAIAMRGFDPIRALVDCKHKDPLSLIADPDYGSNFNWLKPNEDFIRWSVQLGDHGHNGIGGARGSLNSQNLSFTNAVTGHAHCPAIYNGIYRNGKMTEDRLGYNNGAQNWVTAHTILYKGAHREMIIELSGEWKLENTPYDKIE